MEQILGNISILAAAPIFNLGLLIDGLLIGSIFALAAYGLALVWGVMNVKNLAQGDFIMIGGYITWRLGRYGIDPLLGVPVAFVVLWGIGWVLYRTVISKVITPRSVHLAAGDVRHRHRHPAERSTSLSVPTRNRPNADLPTWQFADGLITVASTRIIGFALRGHPCRGGYPVHEEAAAWARRSAPPRRMRAPRACSASTPRRSIRSRSA